MTHHQQAICIWGIALCLHAVILGVLIAFTSALFGLDVPFRFELSIIWMVAFGLYVFIGPVLIYNRIEDAWNRGRSLSRRS